MEPEKLLISVKCSLKNKMIYSSKFKKLEKLLLFIGSFLDELGIVTKHKN